MSVQCQEPIEFYSYMTFDYTNKKNTTKQCLTKEEKRKFLIDKKKALSYTMNKREIEMK